MSSKPLMIFGAGSDGKLNETVAAVMNTAKSKGGWTAIATDVDDIGTIVIDAINGELGFKATEISSIDLIGHGSPGKIDVGTNSTAQATSTAASGMVRHHVLSSDPDAYMQLWSIATLKRPLLSNKIPFRLLGCHTASSGLSASKHEYQEVDGRVLMLALANMLNCRIEGTTDFLNIEDFDDAFKSTKKLIGFGTTDWVPVTDAALARQRPRKRIGQRSDRLSPVRDLLFSSSVRASLLSAARDLPGSMPLPSSGIKGLPRSRAQTGERALLKEISVTGGVVRGAPVSKTKLEKILDAYEDPGLVYPGGDLNLISVELDIKLDSGESLQILSRGRYLRWIRAQSTALFALRSVPPTAAKSDNPREKLTDALKGAAGDALPWIRQGIAQQ